MCVEPIRRITNARTKGLGLSAQGKYFVKSCFCEGLWTEDRAKKSGYLCQGLCPLCQEPDSVGHRIFGCQSVEAVAARGTVNVPSGFCERALHGDPLYFNALKMKHPNDEWPQLSDNHEPILYDMEGTVVPWERF